MKKLHRLFTALIMFVLILGLFSMPGFTQGSVVLAQDENPPATAEPITEGEVAPLYVGESGKEILGQYIVVYKDEIGETPAVTAAASEVSAQGGEVQFVYTSAIKGFAARLTPEMVTALRSDPRVAYIEEDQVISVNDDDGPSAQDFQSGAVWGLDRIDQVSGTNGTFYYPTSAGEGVHVYVIDSGIRTTHNEFGGRATLDYDAVGDGQNGTPDCEPHGTHVSGTIGGSTYGVAKNVTLHGIRVLGCDGYGYYSWVIAGVDWVKQHHIKPAVANMSLGGGASSAVDAAVKAAIASGVTFVVAAGNSGDTSYPNACSYSPARVPAAITVGATDITDTRAYFSNYGSCVDIFAPGVNITSSVTTDDDAFESGWDGTSMASPHVAGVAALYLAGNPTATPATVAAFLIAQSTKNKVTDPKGSPNRLLYMNNTVGAAPVLVAPLANAITNDNDPTLTWNSVYYANGYQVQYANNSAFTSPTLVTGLSDPTYTIPDDALTDGKWYWRASGVNTYGASGPWSTAHYFIVDTTGPNAPVLKSPRSGATSTGAPTFSWSKPLTATRYQFEYNTSNDPGTDDPASVTFRSNELTTISYKPLSMAMVEYYWFARAKDSVGNWGPWSAPFTVTVKPLVPVAPVLNTPATKLLTNDATPELTWKTVAYGDTYQVQISALSTFKDVVTNLDADTPTSYTPDLPLADGKWYWRVRATNENDAPGKWSVSRYFTVDTTAPAAPVLKSPRSGATSTGAPTFSWSKPLTATLYQFEYNTSNDPGTDDKTSVTYRSDELTKTSLKPLSMSMVEYYWFVRAKDLAGNWSAWSAPFTVTVLPLKPVAPKLNLPATGFRTDDTSPDLSWFAVAYGNTYDIQIDNISTFTSPDYTYSSLAGLSHTADTLVLGKWYWRVRAQNEKGVYGPWSTSRYFTILPKFNTQFDTNGDFEGWEQNPGAAWNVNSGALTTNGLGDWITSSASHPATFTDFTYEARMKMAYNGSDYSQIFGLVVRGTPTFNSNNDWQSAYYFTVEQYNDTYFGFGKIACYSVTKITKDVQTSLGGWVCGYDFLNFSDWNNLKVYANGTALKFYINDTLMWGKTVSSPLSGKLGIFTYADYTDPLEVDWAVAGQPVLPTASRQFVPSQGLYILPPGMFQQKGSK